MIKNLSWFTLLLLVFALFSFQSFEDLAYREEGENNHLEMIANEMQQEFEMTRDPHTGTVPRERLIAAKKYADKQQENIKNGVERAAIPNFNWEERGPTNVGGRTRALLIDANDATKETVWAGSASGGLWKTTNFSSSNPNWTPIDEFWSNLAVSAIEQDPSNPQNIYVGTGEGWLNSDAVRGLGVWKSTDGGVSWAQLGSTNNSAFYYVMKIEVASNGDVYIATKDGLYRSKDGGTTFTQVYNASSGFITDIEITPSTFFLAHRGNGIYRSTTGDAGSWTQLITGLPASGFLRIEMAFAPNDPLRLYAMFESSANRNCLGIYKSNDGGTNWAVVTNPSTGGFTGGQAWYNFTIAVDPTNKETVWVGGLQLWRSLNGGGLWSVASNSGKIHADQHVIIFNPANTDNVYFANDGGVYITQNAKNATASTITYTAKSRNYNVTQFYSCAIHPTAGKDWFIAGSQDNGAQLFQSARENATRMITSGDGGFVHIHKDTPNVQVSAYVYSQYYFTRDAWAMQNGCNIHNRRGSFINPSDYDYRSNYLYAGYEAGKFSTVKVNGIKNGPNLTFVIDTPTVAGLGTAKITAVTVSPNTTNCVYVGLNNGDVVKMGNAHLSSRTVSTIRTGGGGISVSCIAVQEGNENHIIVTYSNYGVTSIYETQNGGTSWVNIEGNLPDMPVRWAIFNPTNANQVVIATELGVWSTDNVNGTLTNWASSNSGLANVRTNMLKYRTSDNMIIAATHGRGLFSSDVFATPMALFTVKNPIIYAGRAAQFVNTSLRDTAWTWDFGDGTVDNTENPLHIFHYPGYYNVNLTINNGSSSKTISNCVHVLPYVGTPYIASAGGNFETFGHFDAEIPFGEQIGTAFEWGNPAAGVKTGVASGSKAWATGLTGNYLDNSTAILYSPCFSFLETGVYTVKFKARFATHAQYDGFQLEYSLDKGTTWSLFGTSDLAWYNSTSLGTVFPLNEPMFSGSVLGGSGTFVDFAYATTALQNSPFVSFRFVFKSDGGTVSNGVVIDDFEIDGPFNTPLPVDITEFSGDYKDGKVVLDWHTNTETNCKGFEVQRSLDGQSFEIIGWRNGAGSTAIPQNYSFDDDDIRGSTQYYRLKQIDFNGTFDYSDIIQVFIFPENEANMYVYPNPFVSNINIRLFEALTTNERLKVKLIDKNGVVLAFIPITDTPPIKQISLDLSEYNLASGVYYLEFYAKGLKIGSTKIVRK